MENIFEIFAIFGITGSILMLAVGFLIKSIINHFLQKDLENFKLKANFEIEKYKSEIQLENERHRIVFSKLHNERASVIKELYSKLDTMEQSIRSFMRPLKLRGKMPEEKEIKHSSKCYNEFVDFYRKNKFYFSKSTCEMINEVNANIMKVWGNAKSCENVEEFLLGKISEEKKEWINSWNDMNKKSKTLRELLEDEFRSILGVS